MRPLLVSLFLLALPALSRAQIIDIKGAVQRASTDRPAIHASQARTVAAASAVSEARSRSLPKITFSETLSMTNEPAGSLFFALNQERNVMTPGSGYNLIDPATQHDFETRLTLEQTLFDADAGYHLKEANKHREAAAAQEEWSRESAGFTAFQAYLGVQKALAELHAVTSGEKETAELLRLSSERYRAGMGLKAEELRAQVFYDEAARRTLVARNNVTLAQRRLALAIGQEDGEVEISAPLDADFFSSSPAPSLRERADLQSAALNVESLAIAGQRSQAAYLPRLDLMASYGLHNASSPWGADGQAWRLGAILNWELFDGFRRSAANARIAAEKSVASAELDEARREENFRKAEVRLRIDEARAQKSSAAESVVAAGESQRLLQQRYETGLSDLAELLSAQRSLEQNRFYLVSADIQLLLSLGQALLEEGRFVATISDKSEVSP